MPSPVGHSLGAIAAGLLVAAPAATARSRWIQLGTLAALGVAPDLDLLVGRHNAETHSIGAAVLAATVAALLRWPIASTRPRIFLAAGAAWFSHPLLDALALDTSVPIGVMLWWPFSTGYVNAGLSVFMAISRRWWQPGMVTHNLIAAGREFALLAPVAAAVAYWRVRRR